MGSADSFLMQPADSCFCTLHSLYMLDNGILLDDKILVTVMCLVITFYNFSLSFPTNLLLFMFFHFSTCPYNHLYLMSSLYDFFYSSISSDTIHSLKHSTLQVPALNPAVLSHSMQNSDPTKCRPLL